MNVCFQSFPCNTGYCRFLGHPSNRLADCVVAGRTVRQWVADRFTEEGIRVVAHSRHIVNLEYLPGTDVVRMLAELPESTAVVDEQGEAMAWNDDHAGDCAHVVTSPQPGMKLVYPWHLLDFQAGLLTGMESSFDQSQVSPLASISGVLRLGDGSRILPGVVIEGHVVIGENCRIGPNCYIRGTTSIGDHCVIGQSVEIKSSVIGSHTWISHLSYVGDSVLGDHVNVGAGTVCSNYRHDGGLHKVMLAGELYGTGRNKLGAMIGDGVKLGCHTTIYPGRVVNAGETTLPGQVVDSNLDGW